MVCLPTNRITTMESKSLAGAGNSSGSNPVARINWEGPRVSRRMRIYVA